MRWFPLDKLTLLEAAISEEIEHGTWTRHRDALAVALGLHGLRVGEVCRTRREDLFVGGGVLAVRSLKRGLPREIPLHASTVTALLDWRAGARHSWLLHTRSGNQVHRSQFERAARRLTRAVLGEPLKFHALRHTFAMRLYDETHDPFLVKQMLGHQSIRSTEVYAASLARVPEACLVRLRPDAPGQPAATQLRLFSPTG